MQIFRKFILVVFDEHFFMSINQNFWLTHICQSGTIFALGSLFFRYHDIAYAVSEVKIKCLVVLEYTHDLYRQSKYITIQTGKISNISEKCLD